MKKIIAIIGNANIENSTKKQKMAFKIGKKVIDNNYILATGGLGGVMEYASKGARSSSNYTQGSILGFLPNHDKSEMNPYIDIAIPTGLGLVRNYLLISSADAVVSIGGGSGTLNEISIAWQMKKLIISLKSDGWSEKLGGKSLDKRRDDFIYSVKNSKEAIKIINREVDNYTAYSFQGIEVNSKK